MDKKFGVRILILGVIIWGVSSFVSVLLEDEINTYQSSAGIIARSLDSETQDDYEDKKELHLYAEIGEIFGLVVGVIGIIVLILKLLGSSKEKKKKKSKKESISVPQKYYCPYCGKVIRYIRTENKWYCDQCKRYIEID